MKKKINSILHFMKISHYMLFVATLMFAWLTVSYITPVSSETYEHAQGGTSHDQKLIVATQPAVENLAK